jgi:MscS family membrane protein
MPLLHSFAWDGWASVLLPVALLAAVGVGVLVSSALRWLLIRLTARTRTNVDDHLIARLHAPAAWTIGFLLWRLAASVVRPELPPRAFSAVSSVTHVALFAMLFWIVLRLVDVGGEWLRQSRWARRNSVSRTMVPLATRVAKVVVLTIGVISVLSQLGYPVASLLAGLGIGGIAVALAAQKTVSNLLGTFAIGVDQPLREGDAVKAGDVVGTVEAVGLRSTRIRTADRTIVTVPNGSLADMNIESYAQRDRFRLALTLRLRYSTSGAQLRQIMDAVKALLESHPRRAADAPSVHFVDIGESWLAVAVVGWFETADGGEFATIRDEVLLRCIEIVEAAGSSLAFPPMAPVVPVAPPPAGGGPGYAARASLLAGS